MTISSTTRIAGPFVGTGSASVFPFTFKVFAASDLDVIRLNSSTGVETTLVLTTDYTVTLNGNQNTNPGGSVTLVAGALASGFTLTITSDIANLQPTDLTNQGGFYPEVITDSLDRATIQIQQMADDLTRSIKTPISDGLALNMELPTAAQRANSFLAFDASGEPTTVTAGSSGAPATITRQVFSGTGSQTVFTLASDPGALGNSAQVYIGGVYQQRSTYTIAGTTLTFSAAPVAGTDNIEFVNFLTSNIGATSADLVTYTPAGSGAVARSAASKFGDTVSVKDFGAVGDGVADDTAAFTAAIAAAGTRNVYVPGGSYKITGTVTGDFYSDSAVTIVTGTVNTINRIGSTLVTTGALTVTGTASTGALTVTGTLDTTNTIRAVGGAVTGIKYPTGSTAWGIACAGAVDVGLAAAISVPAGQSVRFNTGSAKLVNINTSSGDACLVFADYKAATVSLVSNPSGTFTNATGTANRISVTKVSNSHELRVMNEFASTIVISICAFGSTPTDLSLGV